LLWLLLMCFFPAPGGDAATAEVRSMTAPGPRRGRAAAAGPPPGAAAPLRPSWSVKFRAPPPLAAARRPDRSPRPRRTERRWWSPTGRRHAHSRGLLLLHRRRRKERHHKERASEAYTTAAGLWPLGSSCLVLVLHRTQLCLERPRQRLDFFLVVARPPAFGCLL